MTSAGTRDPAVSASRDTLTVCILDDEAAVLEMLQSTVEQMGYPTLTTTAPEEALEHIQAGRCRVVLSDIKMPAMDGLAFLERVLEHDPGVYVILMTVFYSVDSAIEAVRRGAYDYLCKPVDRARLKKNLDELSELFSQRRRTENWRSGCSPTWSSMALWEKARRCWRCLTWRGRWPSITPTRC